MRMIPPVPPETSTSSEMRVFSAMKRFRGDPHSVCLSSLNLSRHEYQRWGEIDFLLVGQGGLLVIEVKGGLASCRDGIWRFEDRYGRVIEKRQSPIAQAQGSFRSLISQHLEPEFGKGLMKRIPQGFCAIFPGMRREQVDDLAGGPEMPRTLLGSLEDLADDKTLGSFLKRVMDFHTAATSWAGHSWSSEDVYKVVSFLRPSFDRIPPLSANLASVREEQYRLTEDQYRLLDWLETSPRIVCTGGAGVGKTFVAVEALRREARLNPLMVCGTEVLAAHLRSSNVPNPRQIVTFGEAEKLLEGGSGFFGALIIDEGQQLTNADAVAVFDRLLNGGLAGGRWRWFADPNKQVLHSSKFDPALHAHLIKLGVHIQLRENCRNTPQIISGITVLLEADLGKNSIAPSGPSIMYAEGNSREQLATSAARHLKKWLEDPDVPPGQIVLLSPLPIGRSSIPLITSKIGVPYRRWEPGWEMSRHYPNEMAVATIDEFRGLESPFVLLCDLDESVPEVDRLLYIGMSRANYGLIVACDKNTVVRLATERLRTRLQTN